MKSGWKRAGEPGWRLDEEWVEEGLVGICERLFEGSKIGCAAFCDLHGGKRDPPHNLMQFMVVHLTHPSTTLVAKPATTLGTRVSVLHCIERLDDGAWSKQRR